MNMDGDTGSRATPIRSEIRGSLLDEWRFRAKQAWSEIDALKAEIARLRERAEALSVELFGAYNKNTHLREQAGALAEALEGLLVNVRVVMDDEPLERHIPVHLFAGDITHSRTVLRAYREDHNDAG